MTQRELAVLAAIAAHDGQWSWYQLDRALSGRNGMVGPFKAETDSLAARGLLRVEPAATPGNVRYWITEAGRAALQEN